jgi:hypothetical protein
MRLHVEYVDYSRQKLKAVLKRIALLQIPFFPNQYRRQHILLFYFQGLWFSGWYFDYGGLGCDAVLFDKEEPVASIFGGN